MAKTIKGLLILLALALLLSGCVTDTDDGGNTSGTTSVSTADGGDFVLVKEGAALFDIICGNAVSPLIKQAVIDFHSSVKIATGSNPALKNDYVYSDTVRDPDRVEIIVGRTNYAESLSVYGEIPLDGYGYRAVGKKIVIYGNTLDDLRQATKEFTALIRENITVGTGGKIGLSFESFPDSDKRTGAAVSYLPEFDFGREIVHTDNGDGAGLLIAKNSSKTEYTAYIAALKTDGYKIHTENTIKDNFFATLYKGDVAVDVWFVSVSREMRIAAQKGFDLIPLKGTESTEKTTTPAITVIHGPTTTHMMAFIVTLRDGSFVLIDGGYGEGMFERMLAEMKRQAPDPDNIVISAWIITHTHADHIAALVQFAGGYQKYKQTVRIDGFIYNFAGEEQAAVETQKLENTDLQIRSLMSGVFRDVPKYKVHPGNEFYLADALIEVLGTHESYTSSIFPDDKNACNLFLKITVGGKVFLVTADTSAYNAPTLADMFGDYMKCDILQVTHHGSFGGIVSVNNIYAPSYLIFCAPEARYNNYKEADYNQALLNHPNFVDSIVARDKITYMPISYFEGNASHKVVRD